ncbi:Fc receptor-like protein 5 isoform X6 [Ctenopharyngodon idella]|uniref:Fc receptor-like protein 5 isoform X4 n=1 Tax=Ctenopharyngodon idella TaxID=7959 RepID=UPI002230CD51|nr:Fc receptor-like protein 5 isoform X4 [Ctenopharyngodon idella]XP_051742849.1 Fc receptor-like protein 5 isoform X5 [Ctenopharyngodon idella]XP_051742850.1 Fc receptor-like protein 5 isoform X6 [Ctenopharyngodon idella]
MELSQLPLVLLLISNIHSGHTEERPKPKVSIKPDQHVFRGDSVTLRCDIDAEGVTSWRYNWYKEGSTRVFSELQEHTFRSVSESDAGKYSCYGSERGGSRWSHRSDEVTLTVSERPKPKVSIKPDQHVFRGDSVTLRCDIDDEGVTSWRYNWYKGGSFRVSSELQELTFSSVSESDAGKYSCDGSERGGSHWSHRSDEVTLTVSERPKAKVSIKPDQHVFRGDSVTLRCDIDDEGVTSWRYYWYKGGSFRVFSELQEHTFRSVSESDAGKYSCDGLERGGSNWSHHSDEVTLTVSDFPKPTLTVEPQSSVFTGDSVTLRCKVDPSRDGWEFLWSKNSNPESTEAATKTISPVKVSDGGEYRCRAQRQGYYTDYSEPVTVTIYGKPKPEVSIKPDQHVFRGDSVTLRCDIDPEGVTSWRYNWYKGGSFSFSSELQGHTFRSVSESDASKYSCDGAERGGSRWSHRSDEVTLTLSDPRAVLSVSPQKWLTEGDPVTLICEVNGSSTGWTFSWFTQTETDSSDVSDHYELLSDSSRGSGGKYTVSSAALNHTGVYVCRAEREKTAYKTPYSNKQPLWVTGVSPPVSLIISPSRTQHFTSVSLSLSCENKSNSDGWTVRRYTDSRGLEDCSSSVFGSQTGSTCKISSTRISHTGVYWCQSESGAKSHPVNITVHFGVVLESPVHPVTEGDNLTLHCLYKHPTPSILRADFYKDGSLIQNQTTEMIIPTVSKSHEGFYYCKHPERGESPKSWISVRVSPDSRSDGLKQPVIIGVTAGLTVVFFIIVFLVLLWRYRNNKGGRSESPSAVSQQQNISQTSEQNQSEDGYKTLLSGTAHVYDSVDTTINRDRSTDGESGPTEITYAEIELKSTNKQKKEKENKVKNTESCDVLYSELKLETDQGAGSSEVTYAQVKKRCLE